MVREFFDGWAKVEAAKHAPSSGLNVSSLLPFLPMLIPPLLSSLKSCECPQGDCSKPRCPVRMPCQVECTPVPMQCTMAEIPEEEEESGPDELISVMSKLASECASDVEKNCENCKDSEGCVKSEECEKKCEKSEECEKKCEDGVKSEESEKKPEEGKKKVRRPVYQDGDNKMVVDLGNITGALSGQGGEGMAEMMKMFMPMMSGLMGGMGGLMPPKEKESSEDGEDGEEKKESEDHEEVKESKSEEAALIKIEDE